MDDFELNLILCVIVACLLCATFVVVINGVFRNHNTDVGCEIVVTVLSKDYTDGEPTIHTNVGDFKVGGDSYSVSATERSMKYIPMFNLIPINQSIKIQVIDGWVKGYSIV